MLNAAGLKNLTLGIDYRGRRELLCFTHTHAQSTSIVPRSGLVACRTMGELYRRREESLRTES